MLSGQASVRRSLTGGEGYSVVSSELQVNEVFRPELAVGEEDEDTGCDEAREPDDTLTSRTKELAPTQLPQAIDSHDNAP